MDEKVLVVDEAEAKKLGCDLNEITIGDILSMHKATGMEFVCGDGKIKEIWD